MDALLEVTVRFALVLALALLIERLLEILKALYDLVDSRNDWYRFWTRRAYKVRDYAEKRLRVFEYVSPEKAAPALQRFSEMLLNGRGGSAGTVPVLSGDLVRALAVKIGSKAVGIGLGVGLAFWLSIDLVDLWQNGKPFPAILSPLEGFLLSEPVHIALSGIAIGLGSGPVHKLITTIEKRSAKRKEEGEQS